MLALVPALSVALAAPLPLQACQATPIDRHGWHYVCRGGVAVKIVDSAAPFTPEYRRGAELGIAASLGDGAVSEATRIPLGRVPVEAVRTSRADGRRTAFVVARRRAEGERFMVCFAPDAGSACLPLLEVLDASAWRSGPVAGATQGEVGPLAIAGRSVDLPDGCHGEVSAAGGDVVCGKTSFVNWHELTEQASATRQAEAVTTLATENLAKAGARATRDEVACAIARVPSTCTRFRTTLDGQDLVIVVGLLHADGWAAVTCTALGSSLSSGACGAVFDER